MQFSPALPPLAIVALAILGAVSLIVCLNSKRSQLPRRRQLAVIGLRTVVIISLVVILANPVARQEIETRNKPGSVAVLSDTSASMTLGAPPRKNLLQAWQTPLLQQEETPIRQYGFADRAFLEKTETPTSGTDNEATETPAATETRMGQAILDVLEAETTELRDLIILSDGRTQDPELVAKAIAACKDRGVRISTATLGTEQPLSNISIRSCDAPIAANSRSLIPVTVAIQTLLPDQQTEITTPIQILDEKGKVHHEQTVRLPAGRSVHQLELEIGATSTSFTINIPVQDDEITDTDNQYPFSVDVSDPRIKVLYMEGSNHTTRIRADRSLELHEAEFLPLAWRQEGDIDVDVFVNDVQTEQGGRIYYVKGISKSGKPVFDKSRSFPTSRADLYKYDLIVCSDINRTIFTDEQLQWVVDLVTEEGGGFVMIGGDTAFDAGGWDKTVWEKVIPVDMAEYGRGHKRYSVSPIFPEQVVSHPILQFTGDREVDLEILKIHPRFLGYHLIERAKPGATVLAHSRSGTPLIAVQQYGRGRAMAFLSDAAGGWGDQYQNYWGPRYLSSKAKQLAAARDIEIEDPAGSTQARIGNRFYNRFWVNTVRWLSENARGRGDAKIRVQLPETSASPGDEIDVIGRVIADVKDLPREITATIKGTDVSFILKPGERSGHYGATITLPADLSAGEHVIELKGTVQDKEETAETRLRVDRYNLEFADPNPDVGTLQRIAALTDGTYLESPSDLEAVLKGVDPGQLAAITVTVPQWDRAWLWTLVILAFSFAWLLPKLP